MNQNITIDFDKGQISNVESVESKTSVPDFYPQRANVISMPTENMQTYLKKGYNFNKQIGNENKEERIMNVDVKEYIDTQLSNLEKSLNNKIDSKNELIIQKIDHLNTKVESSLNIKIYELKEDYRKEKSESRKFILTTVISTVGVAVAIMGIIFAWLLQ